jgi:hypothetical protein
VCNLLPDKANAMTFDAMTFDDLAWVFVAAVVCHNLEEAVFLPAWSRSAGRWHSAVGEVEFRFAVTILTLLAAGCAVLAVKRNEIGVYLLCGYALAMALNVFFPHVAATIVLKRYMPGTATGVLINLPVCVLLLIAADREGLINNRTFGWSAPLVVIGLLASVPILFRIGRLAAPAHRERRLPLQ